MCGLITPFIFTLTIMTVKRASIKHGMDGSLFSFNGQACWWIIVMIFTAIYWTIMDEWKDVRWDQFGNGSAAGALESFGKICYVNGVVAGSAGVTSAIGNF